MDWRRVLDPTLDDSPEERAAFAAYALEVTLRASGPVALFIGLFALGVWPTDPLLFDDPVILRAFAAWRVGITGLAVLAWVITRLPGARPRVHVWMFAILLAGSGLLGASFGYAGGLDTPWFHCFYLAPMSGVLFLYPLAQRLGLSYGMGIVFASAFFLLNPAALASPWLGSALVFLSFACLSAAAFGHLVYILAHQTVTQDLAVRRKAAELAVAHARAERLLLNVLPKAIASRLADRDSGVADGFTDASVLFADVVGFTSYAQQHDPDEVVSLLDRLFSRFDALVDAAGLEKIKTIGDAYMVAGNLPSPRGDHLDAMAELALAMLGEARQLGEELGHPFAIRIGLHSGPAVAGVIGRRKFSYDLWGDTVNTASRLESHGRAGCVHISAEVAERLRGRWPVARRGVVELKGKGPTETWWLGDPPEAA